MRKLTQIKQELKNILPLGIDLTLQTIKNYLPTTSAKYNEVILLEGRYQTNHKLLLKDTENNEKIRQETNRIREALLLFINDLEEQDFEKLNNNKSKPKRQRGSILYRIPNEMEVQKETPCLVRIAFDKKILKEDLDLADTDVIKSIRVSEVMGVELIDPNENTLFQIRTFSESIQLIYKDDYTEWTFYVKPFQVGKYALLLKVSVIEIRDGRERKRDIVLQETVVITTEPVPEMIGTFKAADYSFVIGGDIVEKSKGVEKFNIDIPVEKTKNSIFKRLVLSLFSLLFLLSVSYAAIPRVAFEIDWMIAKLQGDKECYQSFVQKYEKQKNMSERKQQKINEAKKVIERIEWEEADKDTSGKEFYDYLDKYGDKVQFDEKTIKELPNYNSNIIDGKEYLEDKDGNYMSKQKNEEILLNVSDNKKQDSIKSKELELREEKKLKDIKRKKLQLHQDTIFKRILKKEKRSKYGKIRFKFHERFKSREEFLKMNNKQFNFYQNEINAWYNYLKKNCIQYYLQNTNVEDAFYEYLQFNPKMGAVWSYFVLFDDEYSSLRAWEGLEKYLNEFKGNRSDEELLRQFYEANKYIGILCPR